MVAGILRAKLARSSYKCGKQGSGRDAAMRQKRLTVSMRVMMTTTVEATLRYRIVSVVIPVELE